MRKSQGHTRPFIIYPRRSLDDVRDCIISNYGCIKYELPFINALCIQVPEKKIPFIKNYPGIARMSEDILVTKLPVASSSGENPYSSCFALPWKGKGVSIAVIDTGVSPHYDLIKPGNRIIKFMDFLHGKTLPYDDDGHGTHVAGIALSNGYLSGRCGTAPESNLVALKALDDHGNGSASHILAAMQWISENHKLYNIKVVNLSLGIPPLEKGLPDPLILGCEALVSMGISVVTAAGNGGPGKGTVTSPGISPMVITVGSCHKDRVTDFSSRGPTPYGVIKPDLVAPGVDILSLSNDNCKSYVRQSGTSMSCPHVAGIAAAIYGRYHRLTPLQLKKILLGNTFPLKKDSSNAQGHGRIILSDNFF